MLTVSWFAVVSSRCSHLVSDMIMQKISKLANIWHLVNFKLDITFWMLVTEWCLKYLYVRLILISHKASNSQKKYIDPHLDHYDVNAITEFFVYFFPLCFFFFFNNGPSNVHKLSYLKGGGVGQKLPILLSKKMTKRGGGGQKLLILRQHILWMAPKLS